MPEQARMPRFIPKIGFSAGLNNLSLEEGYFIVTLDDKQLYVDAKLEDANTGQWTITRVPLGGYTTIWGNVNEKPFDDVSSGDFTIITDENTHQNILYLDEDLKFNNKSTLDKFTESNNELLFDLKTIPTENVFVKKGRVDSRADLVNVETTNLKEGDIYYVGQTSTATYEKFTWHWVDENNGRWEPIYLNTLEVPYSIITGKPKINNFELTPTTTLANIGAAAAIDLTATQAMIADTFDTTTPYTVDDYVIYNNKLYKFNSAHSAGAWNSSEVSEIQVSDMIGSGGGGSYTLPAATTSTLGGIIVGAGLSIAADGTLSVTGGSSYTLPAATTTTLGGIIVGTGLNIAQDGTLSVSGGGGSSVVYNATALASGWSNSAPYTQTITVNGLTSAMNPIIDVVLSDTTSTAIDEGTAWSYVGKATTGTNSITLKCYENKPTVDLDFIIKT